MKMRKKISSNTFSTFGSINRSIIELKCSISYNSTTLSNSIRSICISTEEKEVQMNFYHIKAN